MKKIFILLTLLAQPALAEKLTTSIGDRVVSFSLVEKNKSAWLDMQSNEIGKKRLPANAANKKYFQDTLKSACAEPLYEVGCDRYSIVIERRVGRQDVKCTFCYNSEIRQAKIARNALQVLSMAVAAE